MFGLTGTRVLRLSEVGLGTEAATAIVAQAVKSANASWNESPLRDCYQEILDTTGENELHSKETRHAKIVIIAVEPQWDSLCSFVGGAEMSAYLDATKTLESMKVIP